MGVSARAQIPIAAASATSAAAVPYLFIVDPPDRCERLPSLSSRRVTATPPGGIYDSERPGKARRVREISRKREPFERRREMEGKGGPAEGSPIPVPLRVFAPSRFRVLFGPSRISIAGTGRNDDLGWPK